MTLDMNSDMYPVTKWINCLIKFNNSHKLWHVTKVARCRINRAEEYIATYYGMTLSRHDHKKYIRQLKVIFEHRDITKVDDRGDMITYHIELTQERTTKITVFLINERKSEMSFAT